MNKWEVISRLKLLLCCFVIYSIGNVFPVVALSEAATDQPVDSSVIETAPGVLVDSFSYNPAGRRDPFVPLVNKLQKSSRVAVSKPRGPLQKYELTQFRLMAVLVVKGRPMAMVKAPDGKSYPLKIGDEIGRYEGRVVNIETRVTEKDSFGKRIEKSPDRVVVEETVRDNFTGKQSVENRYLSM